MIRYRNTEFLIEPTPTYPRWQLSMIGTRQAPEILGYYDTPEKAARALATFQTDSAGWNAMPTMSDGMANRIKRLGLDDLKNWQREEV